MEINLKFDEAEIIKDCLNGLKKDEIKQKIIQEVIKQAVAKISSTLYKKAEIVLNKSEINKAVAMVSQESKKDLSKELKTYIKQNLRDYKIEDMVNEYLTGMIEEYFEYSPVSIEFKFGKTKKTIGVLDSKLHK